MFLRISNAALLMSVAACSPTNKDDDAAIARQENVPCAFGEAKKFSEKCRVEHSSFEGKNYVTLWHPNGGFRRLEVLDGGKIYASADGADLAVGGPNGAEVEVMIGDDHYLMPAAGAVAKAQP